MMEETATSGLLQFLIISNYYSDDQIKVSKMGWA
jgi:hypothetical protein